jgi:hypothetical protein
VSANAFLIAAGAADFVEDAQAHLPAAAACVCFTMDF